MSVSNETPRNGLRVEEFTGDIDAFRAEMAAFTRDSHTLNQAYDRLLAESPDQWVACHDGVIFADSDMGGLFAQLRAAGVDPAHAAMAFLRTGKFAFSDR